MIITDIEYLRTKSKRTSWTEIRELKIVERMKKEIKTAWVPGVGLAAIQIGEPLRFTWYMWNGLKEFDKFLINPEIIETSERMMSNTEGCLSIPNQWLATERFNKIKYVTDGQTYEAERFEAHIIQHEIDHMDGILVTNRKWEGW